MKKYALNEEIEDLELWPFDNPESNYLIISGNPVASGRLDEGSNNGPFRLGIWRCTEGRFECTELGNELQTIISGHLSLTRDDGQVLDCGPGDSIYTRKGERVIWQIHDTVTKVFLTILSG
jgi:uncharacterized cupin superfamily protein